MTYEEAIKYLEELKTLRVTVSGDIGSGKSTFATHLAEDLDVPRVYAGQIMREEAAKRGITLQDFQELLEVDDKVDREVDALQLQKSEEIKKGIFEGRVAWHFNVAPDVRLFFSVRPEVGADRVYGDKDNSLRDKYISVEEVIALNKKRKSSEETRYNSYYGISAYNLDNFDLVIDTSDINIHEVFEKTVIRIAQFLAS
jgi:cytidylate kinase